MARVSGRSPVNSDLMFLLLSKALNVVGVGCVLYFLPAVVFAQKGSDACHVYVLDSAKSRQAFESFRQTGNEEADAKALAAGQTLFPEFYPVIGEEELTTKHYRFPHSKLFITASVYYTDESMASHPQGQFAAHNESMLVGVTVARKAKANAISDDGANSIAEVTYDQYTNIVRAKKYVTVRGRRYLVGIQCDCMVEKRSK